MKLYPVILAAVVLSLFTSAYAGSVSGHVYDDQGLPLQDVYVEAYDENSGNYFQAYTLSDGSYVIQGITEGYYTIAAYGSWNGGYIDQYYDHQNTWEGSQRLYIDQGTALTGIDFDLVSQISVSGRVVDQFGQPVSDVMVNCWSHNWWYGGSYETGPDGTFQISSLAPDLFYKIILDPADGTNYRIKVIPNIYLTGDYDTGDLLLESGGLTLTGRVTSNSTAQGLAGICVNVYYQDFDYSVDTYTDPDGYYSIDNLFEGDVHVSAIVWDPSPYAGRGTEFYLDSNTVLDFALLQAASITGRVIDADSGLPLSNVNVEYWNDKYEYWSSYSTEPNGFFKLTNLPEGFADIEIYDPSHTYAPYLTWPANKVCLSQGQNMSGKYIALVEGITVQGRLLDASGSGIPFYDIEFDGKYAEGWPETDTDGNYSFLAVPGEYSVKIDTDDGLTCIPAYITINPEDTVVNVPDITAYDSSTGLAISGTVQNPSSAPYNMALLAVAFPEDTPFDPDSVYTLSPASSAFLPAPGAFTIESLDPSANYDIYLVAFSTDEYEDDIISIRDTVYGVSPGSTGVSLTYPSAGGTVEGYIQNQNGDPVSGAMIGIFDSNGRMKAFTGTDCSGYYEIFNVAPSAGNYDVYAMHPRYSTSFASGVSVSDSALTTVPTIALGPSTVIEYCDLDGSGSVSAGDLQALGQMWLTEPGYDLTGLSSIAEMWLMEALWLN